jgi:large subunit ribosomal protein L29
MKENAERARALDTNEIEKQMRESNEQMFRLRFQMRMGQMEGLKKYRSLRRERARMLTVLRERDLHPEAAAAVQAEAAAHQKARKKAPKKAAAKKAPVVKPVAKKEAAEAAKKTGKAAKPAAAGKKSAPKPAPAHKPVRTPRPASKG